jgi:NADH:ubiquinone oxidoreductase subunit K
MSASPLTSLLGAFILLTIGLIGLLISRNLIKTLISLQVLVKAALLAVIAAGAAQGQIDLGQSLAVTIIVADTIVAVVGLALAVAMQRRFGTLDLGALTLLRR